MESISVQPELKQKELFGHPVGLYILFMTEMWERFSYYGMRAILVLYLVHETTSKNPGVGWTNGEALALYGWYTMLAYVACIPGGIIADKVIGQKNAVLVGGILLTIGHGILAVHGMFAFYTGLILIVLGVGMLKANISTMVGGLYPKGDIRRDKGFTIFYIGINVGALLSSLIVGYLGEKVNWHVGFGTAGVAMLIGLVIFAWGRKYLKNVGNFVPKSETEGASFGELFGNLFKAPLQLGITIVLVLFSVYWMVTNSIAYGILFIFISLVVAMMMMMYRDITSRIMKDRYVVMLLAFMMTIVFWGAFEQAGGLMNIYASEKTNRIINWSWFHFEVPATWFQSVNAIFIVIFGVIVANFWARRKLKGREASSLFKMASGTIIMGLGFVFMALASKQFMATGSSAMYWLVLAYLFHTIGELSSSPVALSFITKLSPIKYGSIMMGLYFAATGFGNKLAGVIGEASQGEPAKVLVTGTPADFMPYLNSDTTILADGKDFKIKTDIYPDNEGFAAIAPTTGTPILGLITFDKKITPDEIANVLKEHGVTKDKPYHATLNFSKIDDAKEAVTGDKLNYEGVFVIEEVQSKLEFRTFIGITIFTALFGILIILILKPLKRLTHGVEDDEH